MNAAEGSVWTSENVRLFFADEERFHIDDRGIADMFRTRMPERVADLLDIAMECQSCDRLTTRQMGSYGLGWCRELRPVIHVRDLNFWRDPEVAGLLVGVLDWLTDDHWDPTFLRLSPDPQPTNGQDPLFRFPMDDPAVVACHSGGLDSFGGVTADLDNDSDLNVVLAGTSSATRATNVQKILGDAITAISGRTLPLMVRTELIGATGQTQDHHQRSRGLLFLSVAAATAVVGDVAEVRMYENGVGAINLPYSDGQIGAQMSRSAHPKTLVGMQALLDAMEVGPVRFRAPQALRTKAQLVADIPEAYSQLISKTISCDRWASRRKSVPDGDYALRCGHCTSCLLRRVSLCAAGYKDLDRSENYELDAFASSKPPEELHLMVDQVARLDSATRSEHPWYSLTNAFPQLVEARDALRSLGESQIEGSLVQLYTTYVQEWHHAPTPLVQRYLGASRT